MKYDGIKDQGVIMMKDMIGLIVGAMKDNQIIVSGTLGHYEISKPVKIAYCPCSYLVSSLKGHDVIFAPDLCHLIILKVTKSL